MAVDGPQNAKSVRVRIAPSPTGDPHVGTAYIALFNYVFAKQHHGQFILRIEDTDRARSRADSEAMIFEALRWVGLEWDEGPDKGGPMGPYRQSERSAIYAEHAQILLDTGKAYRCFCTTERLAELRERQRANKERLGYDRHCRAIAAGESSARANAQEPHVVRLAMPTDGKTRYRDHLRGDIEFENAQIDDQVLLKSDGFPTYHLANVVDDHLMQITHVIRAEEWITSTPKHVLLYEAFGWQQPTWIHMPLLRNSDKSKISKRKNPVSINFYRDLGVLPEALLNFLAIMGWSLGGDREKFTLAEMIDGFDWARVSLGGPVFDQDKLRWLNEQYIHALSHEELVDRLQDWRLGREHLLAIAPLMRERIKVLSDFIPGTEFFFSGGVDHSAIAADLKMGDAPKKDIRVAIAELIERYEALESWEPSALETASRTFCDDKGLKAKHVFMLVRLLVTGRKASPGLFETMAVLGKELCRYRMRQGSDLLATLK